MNSSENNSIRFCLDGVRLAPDGYTLCRNVNEAKKQILRAEESKAKIEIIDCNHDLEDYTHDEGDGIKLLDWLAERQTFYPIALHTMNPVAREICRGKLSDTGKGNKNICGLFLLHEKTAYYYA